MKAALYARVSSEKQIYNFSISAQIDSMKEYCKNNKIEIYDIYVDEAEKGWKANRPALQKMLSKSKEFDIVLVHKFNRFARKKKLSESLKAQLIKNKVKVISITEHVEETPIGYFTRDILDSIAEYEINNLSSEIKKGKTERMKQGYWNGLAPYGYEMINNLLVIKEDEAEIVREIFNLYAINGLGATKISHYLNKNNIKTRRNNIFAPNKITYILRNATYTGKIKYNGDIYEGRHEAIISDDIYERSLNNLVVNNTNPSTGRNGYRSFNYNLYYLLDIVRCGVCGAKFVIRNNERNSYYCCGAYRNEYHNFRKDNCINKKFHNAKKFERAVEHIIKSFTKGNDVNFTLPTLKNKLNNISESRLEEINKELDRIKKAFIRGIFDIAEYGEEKKKLEGEKEILIYKINEPVRRVNPNIYKDRIKNIWKSFITEKEISKKRTILQQVIQAIYIDDKGKTRIELNL